MDQAGVIVLVNPQTERLFGYQQEDILGRPVEVLIPEPFRERHRGHRTNFFSDPRPMGVRLQLFGLRKDGTEFPVEISLSPVETAEGTVVTSAIRDITERTFPEASRLRLATIVESSDDAIISKALDGTITSWNAGAQRIFGYTEAEAVGQPITILIPPELMEEENRILEKLRVGERIDHYETIRVTKAGKRINVSLTIGPMRDSNGKLAGFSKIARDITERKQAQEALRISEERLRLAYQAARLGTFEWNIRTGMNTWTPELEGIYGLPPGGFAGTQAAFVNLVHSDDREGVLKLVDRSLKTGQTTRGEWRVVWPDGSVHWVAARWQVFMNESGEPSRVIGVNGDITERKRAEQELAKANERLHLAMEAGAAGGWDYDLETGKDVWFGEAHAQLGMTPDETLGTRKEFWDRVHEDDRERVEHALQVAKEKREDFGEDVRVVWRDGTIHWLRSRGRFHYAANGVAERSLGMSLDITERKMAEDKLREYERAVEGSEEMICVVDREYRYLIANNQFLKTRNMTSEQVVGHFAHEVLNKGFFESVVKPKLDECFQGKVVRYETKYNYPEIGERDIFISYFPIEGANGIDRVACILQDITDRKRNEESLRESEQRFCLAAQTGKMYSFEWDVTTDVVVRSPERVKVLGAIKPLRFSHQQFVDTIHPDDRPKFTTTIAGLTPEHPTAEVIYRVRDSDGALVWLKSSGRAFFDSGGRMLRVIGMVADITDLKRAEEALADMTRKLIAAQEQERARIGRELHDDINQRLAMLSLELEQLQHDPSEFQRRVQDLRKGMSEISDDVQALSHDLHSSKLEYLGVVHGMKSWCKEFAERQKMEIEFRSEVSSALPLAVGLSLFRVLQEALNNAIKHSGVKRVEVQLREDSGEIRIVISDLGRGFDVEAASQGKGLGLTSMRERVRLVNGTISIESKPMGGTAIHVRVPLGSEQEHQRAFG
jgi:PAS domain S-box-containing protein